MMLKKLCCFIITASVLSAFFTLAADASYVQSEDSMSWDLTNISSEIEYDKSAFQNGQSYEYNGLVLHGGAGADITEKGLIGNKNGGYIEYTPVSDGTLTVTADMNAGAKLFADNSTSARSNLIMETETDTAKMEASTQLKADTKYYIYNGTSNSHKIKSLRYAPLTEPAESPNPENPNGQYIHMSFDDVYLCLKDLTANAGEYNSVFDNSFFAFLKELHTKYNAVFSLYCFNTADGWDISNVTDKFQTEFSENSDWIKFGFHAEDADANYGNDDGGGTYGTAKGDCTEELEASYKKFLDAVEKLTGNSFESVDHIARLGFFGGTRANIKVLQKMGMTGFLGADSSSRLSYYLTDAAELYRNGFVEDLDENLLFLSSQSRLESVAKAEESSPGSAENYLNRIANLKDAKVIEIFTHEGRWTDENVQNMTERYLSWAVGKGYGFDYAQNVYEAYAPKRPSEETEWIVSEIYDFTTTADKIQYDENAFQNGTIYEYEGIKIIGGNSAARIDENGIRFTKQASGQMYIEYIPSESGKLKIEATAGHSGEYYSVIYADETLGARKNAVITASEDGLVSGETNVEAGKKYYIYNASSAPTVFTEFTLLTNAETEKTAEITLYNIYGDNMMIQRGKNFMLSGKCRNITGAEICVVNDRTKETEQTKQAVVNPNLTWSTELDAVDNYSDTYTITITPQEENAVPIVISNVLFGDVFLMSGQSNTVREIGFYKTLGIDYTDMEYKAMPNIRMLDITGGRKIAGDNTGELKSSVPCDEFVTSENITYEIIPEWTEFTSDLDYESISALAYSFLTKLNEQTDVPVGIISTGYDGTEIAQWMPDSGTNFYNSRIYPFRVFNLKGILWYQGESDRNMSSPLEEYKKSFTSLVHHYREMFANEEDVPFYYVAIPRTSGSATDPQNPEIGATANAKLALIRQAQTEVYTELSKTEQNFGIVPTLDIYGNKNYNSPLNGETENGNNRCGFHTGQKPLIAQRLVNLVLKDLYNEDVKASGPVFESGISKDGKLILTYKCLGSLKLLDKDLFTDSYAAEIFEKYGIDASKPQEFEIAGEDGIYYRADAELEHNKVILSSENVPKPVCFRYAQSGYGGDTYIECPNLTDDSGLPALVTAAQVNSADIDENIDKMTISEDGTRLIILSSERRESVVLMRAVYNEDGILEEVKKIEDTTSLNEGVNEVSVISKEERKTVKFFLWNSLENMQPICGAV